MFNALSDFLIYCRVERRLADLTCKADERDVRACLDFLRGAGIAALAEVRMVDLRRFLAEEATHRPAPSSQARTVAALRCFFRFCVQSDYLERDPAHVLSTPKKREALPDVLDRGELSRLLDVPGREGVWTRLHAGKVERDRLLLALFAYGGLRRSELLGLDCYDVDLERRLIRVRKAKGGRERVVPIHPGLCAAVPRLRCDTPADERPGSVPGRPGPAPNAEHHGADIPPLRHGGGCEQAQAHNAPHTSPCVRNRASERGREPAPDSGASRT
jgi:site-specific recombinase XerD